MPKRSYKGDKRRREIAKKKKRDEKLTRKHSVSTGADPNVEDKSYLEYLHPGGLPEELQEKASDEESESDSVDGDSAKE